MFGGLLSKLRSPFHASLVEVVDTEHQDALVEQADKGDALERMQQSLGWKHFEEEMREHFNKLQAELRHAPLENVPQLQAKLVELEWISEYITRNVKAGKEARDRLAEIMLAAKESN
jgi:hypothetical protein